MHLSVIIPTFNRSKTLSECLHALYHQNLSRSDYEVIVVDDGSTDDTSQVVACYSQKYSSLHYFMQKNQGQGIARNYGISKATGHIVVFIGDDIMVDDNFLSEHLRFHQRFINENEAVLGFTTWHPKLNINHFMRWMTNGSSIFGKFGGHQFAYEKLDEKYEADYNFFYTSNLSLKRSLLKNHQFDPDFAGYGWEDIELGYRLYKKAGLKLYYNCNAIGYHDHAMSEDSLAARMRQIGRSSWIFHCKYPELGKVPSVSKEFALRLLSNPVSIFFFTMLYRLFPELVSDLYFYALSKNIF